MDRHNGEQAPIVILATHIIQDISELCTLMASLNRGEMIVEAELRRAVEARTLARAMNKAECHHEPAVHS